MADSYIRVPADSTGKRIRHLEMLDLKVTSVLIDLNTLDEDDVITGLTSGTTAKYKSHSTDEGITYIYVVNPTGDFTDTELLQVNAVTIATVSGTPTLKYSQSGIITDHDNPGQALSISKKGAAYVRFTDGAMNFDAFGGAQFSETIPIKAYTFLYGDDNTDVFWDQEIGAGTVTASAETSQLILSVDSTSGSRAVRTTQQYFPYQPGEGNLYLFSVVCGDAGKSGLIRRWGAYDDDDGLFFQQSGSDICVGKRTSTSGTPIDTIVKQDIFNGEKLDDATLYTYVIDETTYQVYWLDFQWLGSGRVRFGSYAPDGSRITMHSLENINVGVVPYMKRGTLPIRVEIVNETNTSGNSSIGAVCLATARQSSNLVFNGPIFTQHSSGSTIPVSGSDWVPLMTFKPKTTYNGVTNRTQIIPMDFEWYVDGDALEMHAFANANLTGSTYSVTKGAWDIDIDATSFTGGVEKQTLLVPAGVTKREIRDDNFDFAQYLTAQGIAVPITVAVKCIKATGTANVSVLSRWKQVH